MLAYSKEYESASETICVSHRFLEMITGRDVNTLLAEPMLSLPRDVTNVYDTLCSSLVKKKPMTPTNWVEKLLLQQYAANPAVRLHEPHLAIGFCWQTHGHLLGGRLGLGWLWQGYWFVTLQAQLSVLSVPRLHRRPLNRWGCDSFFSYIASKYQAA